MITHTLNTLPYPDPKLLQAAKVAPAGQAEHDRIAAEIGALATIEYRPPSHPAAANGHFRLAAWNAERCKYQAESAMLLRAIDADILLLSEFDLGMARSGNRHTTADLAADLGMGYAYGVEFVELDLGDDREQKWHVGESNAVGLHGNAILSRYPLRDLTLIKLDDGGRWYGDRGAEQRRIGGRMGLAARIAVAAGDCVVVSAHLESDSDPTYRAQQTTRLLAALADRYGDMAMVIGGDCNTDGIPAGKDPRHWSARCEVYEPLFAALSAAGFDWHEANDMAGTQRTRPDGTPEPPFRRIDWLFTRGLSASAPRTVPAVDETGSAISDHDAVVADLMLG